VHTTWTSYSNLIEITKLSFTIFEILSLIFQKLKRSRDNDQAPFRDSLSSVGYFCGTFISHPTNLVGRLIVASPSPRMTKKTAHWFIVCATQFNCCNAKFLAFFSWVWPPTAESWTPLTTRFGVIEQHEVRDVSQQGWQNEAVIQHLCEKMLFCQRVQKHYRSYMRWENKVSSATAELLVEIYRGICQKSPFPTPCVFGALWGDPIGILLISLASCN